MSKTVIALFDNAGRARDAVDALKASGFVNDRIEIQSGEEFVKHGEVPPLEHKKHEGLYRGIKAFFDEVGLTLPHASAQGEYHPIRPNDAIVLLETSDERADTAAALLDREGAVNVEERIERKAPAEREHVASGLEPEVGGKMPRASDKASPTAEHPPRTYSTADTTRPRNSAARIYGPANEPYDDDWAPRGPKPL